MKLRDHPPLHLTYCLNIHPGETWPEVFRAIEEKALAVRSKVGPGRPFGLGLRLGAAAAHELQDETRRSAFKDFLKQHDLYVFTLNGFPYGRFHGARVKEGVYRPDWRSAERLEYTCLLADLLADLLPECLEGSISTVPCSFKPWIAQPADVTAMVKRLMGCVEHLARLEARTGREVHLGLEPEPGCYLETSEETIRFFKDTLYRAGRDMLSRAMGCGAPEAESLVRRHLGVCFDTCHAAVQFEEAGTSLRSLAAEGIRLSKVQLSAALEITHEAASLAALRAFEEPVYLHQTRARRRGDDRLRSWMDLPEALTELSGHPGYEAIRVHFHVPLFWAGTPPLASTAGGITVPFLQAVLSAGCRHLEIETYTFEVLPAALRAEEVTASIAREYAWVLARLSNLR